MKISKVAFFVGLLMGFTYQSASAATTHETVDFLPVNVSFGCQDSTVSADRMNYMRADGAWPGVAPIECVDREKSIMNISPLKVELAYNRIFKAWRVVVFLNDKDALAVRSLSAKNVGGRILVGTNGKILFAAPLTAPIANNRIDISAESEDEGNRMLVLFSGNSRH